ncbi:MAG TPA: type I-U CRISPR-associated protein Csx17 [Bryobacteraceae bacterium]|nr:type I-U CRISPR-associated protein Csx17 [Bryobacteraceae bacterium]
MQEMTLEGCATSPLGSFLKALAILRLVSEQADTAARGWWDGDRFRLRSELDENGLIDFFLDRYVPTPILAPWNGGSGFYPKDRQDGIAAIESSTAQRFEDYRAAIAFLKDLPEVRAGKSQDEEERRSAILRAARNWLPDSAVEWLDAAVGVSATGKRAFAPIVGTGGNEGRLDYTNNFMQRLAQLLIAPDSNTPVRPLLENALFGTHTAGFQSAATGQFDPGRAGGFNQGQGIETPDIPINPWDFVFTLEGAVAWASGLYRRHGVSYDSLLCSPFTVRADRVGFGSASKDEEARAEIWVPVWPRPSLYSEIKVLLREGRASLGQKPAKSGLDFAEAATSLGVDRGVDRFVRYSILMRRGKSYIALPAGSFPVGYRGISDRVRELRAVLDLMRITAEDRRGVDAAAYEALLHGGPDRLRDLIAAFGRMVQALVRSRGKLFVPTKLPATQWIEDCGPDVPEVRIAAALASIRDRAAGPIRSNLMRNENEYAWVGIGFPERLMSVIEKRLRSWGAPDSGSEQTAAEGLFTDRGRTPFGASYELCPGDATLFIERSVDDELIEDLLFAFVCLNWTEFRPPRVAPPASVLPIYAVLKHLFLGSAVEVNGERKHIRPDARILSYLRSRNAEAATDVALRRLRVAGLNPLNADYRGGVDPLRLAASLLIPVRAGDLQRPVLNESMEEVYS